MGTWSLLVVLLISSAASLENKCPSNILEKFLSDRDKEEGHYDNGETVNVTCPADSGYDGYDYLIHDDTDGLDMKNIRVLKCTDGKWIGHYPECFSNCSKPDIYADLKPEYEVYAPGDNVTVTACKTVNAKIEGDTTLVCAADGTWIGRARCPKQHKSCNTQLPTIPNAYKTDVVLDEYKHGTVLLYKCSQAFDQMGKISVTCNDGEWIQDSTNPTKCIIGRCSPINSRVLGNMRVKNISGEVGTFAKFECYDGYVLEGSAEIVCMADRKWHPEIPKCKPISCPPPKQILNGRLIQEAYDGLLNIYQSMVRYGCDKGYRIVGPQFRMCQSDRTWSGNDTKCEEIVCEKPSPPENGNVYLTDNSQKVGSQIEYICDEFHTLEPITSKFAICTEHGHWSSPQPRCIKICEVRALTHGLIRTYSGIQRIITEDSYVHDNTALYFTCNHGYEMYAGGYITWGSLTCVNGALLPGSPECRPKRCFISLTTNPEYFIGQEKLLDKNIQSGIVMNARCSNKTELFRSSSYLEREHEFVTCFFGKFQPELPVCREKRCNIMATVDNGHFMNRGKEMFTGEKVLSGNNIQLKCSEGYELYNKANYTYLMLDQTYIGCYQGSFTSVIPSCMPKRCFISPSANLEYFIGQEKVLDKNIQSGTVMNARCSNKTELFLSSSYLEREQVNVMCYLGRLDPESPVCKDKRCNIIATIDNGDFISKGKVVVTGEKINSGSNIQLQCFEGYELYYKTNSMYPKLAHTDIRCYQGSFTSEIPSCVPKRCFIVPSANLEYFIGQEKVLDNNIQSGTVMNARCSNKTELFRSSSYLLREQVNVTCYLGRLDPESPVCKDKRCNIMRTIDNGHLRNSGKVVVSGEKIPSGSNIRLICLEGYELYNKANDTYLMLDQTYISCYQGSFISEIPSCEPKRCLIKPPVDMEYFIEGNKVSQKYIDNGTIMQARCPDRMELVLLSSYLYNETSVQCIVGTLEPRTLECKWKRCKLPVSTEPVTGFVVIGKESTPDIYFPHYQIIEAVCKDGYRQQGTFTCQEGILTGNSTCEPEVCSEPEFKFLVLTNGILVNEDTIFSHGTKLNASCESSFTLHADTDNGGNGTWTECIHGEWKPKFRCKHVTGCVLTDPGMHFISPSNRSMLEVGENANVSCKFGYQIVSNIFARPEYDYHDSESTAEASEIPESEDNENLVPVRNGNYTCRADGKWEPELRFSCKQIVCDSFDVYNLENGKIIYSSHYDYTVGTVASFHCDPGYTRQGPETRTCQIDGTWSGKCVTCQKNNTHKASITCPAPCIPVGARKTGSHPYEIDSIVQFHCPQSKWQDRDDRSSIIKCIKKGKHASWNGTVIDCKDIICDKWDHYGFENGRVIYSSSVTIVGTEASFICNPEYNLIGNRTKICQKDGNWSPGCVKCQKHQPNSSTCPAPCVPDGAKKIGSLSYEIGSIIQLYCFQSNMDYNVNSRYIRHCVSNGTSAEWNGSNINCKAKCEPLTDSYNVIQNGVVPGILSDKTVVELNCNRSQKSVQAVCRKGHWNPKKPTCASQCEPLIDKYNVVQDGVVPGILSDKTVVEVICNRSPPFYNKTAECTNGRWKPKKPTCEYTCSLSPVKGTLYRYKETQKQVFHGPIASDRQIKVTCESGFLPNKQTYDVSRCVNGVWTPEIVKCEEKRDTCSLSPVKGTLYSYKVTQKQVFHGPIKSDRQIKVTCEDGYFPNIQDYDVSRCVNGVWKPKIVKCEKRDTCSLSPVKGTQYSYYVTKEPVSQGPIASDRQIKVTCESGFLPNKQTYEVSKCVNGVWTPEIVKCEKRGNF